MNIYAIADLHLSFCNDIDFNNLEDMYTSKPMGVFGEKWHNHHVKLWRNWNETVSEEDIVLVPGDISWALKLEETVYDFKFIEKLPGHKILGRGNHDYWWKSVKKISETVADNVKILQNNFFYLKNDLVLCGTRGWLCPNDEYFKEHDRKIFAREIVRLENSLQKAPRNKNILVMLHYPPVNDKHEKNEFIEVMQEYPVTTCIYGHLHSYAIKNRLEGEKWGINFALVSADYLNFTPKLMQI